MTLHRTRAPSAEAKLHAIAPCNYKMEGCVGTMERMEDGHTHSRNAYKITSRWNSFVWYCVGNAAPKTKLILLIFWKFEPLISKDYLAILKCLLFLLCWMHARVSREENERTRTRWESSRCCFGTEMRKRKCKKCAPVQINKRIINSVKYDGVLVVKGQRQHPAMPSWKRNPLKDSCNIFHAPKIENTRRPQHARHRRSYRENAKRCRTPFKWFCARRIIWKRGFSHFLIREPCQVRAGGRETMIIIIILLDIYNCKMK